jgi:hypothetical protein
MGFSAFSPRLILCISAVENFLSTKLARFDLAPIPKLAREQILQSKS